MPPWLCSLPQPGPLPPTSWCALTPHPPLLPTAQARHLCKDSTVGPLWTPPPPRPAAGIDNIPIWGGGVRGRRGTRRVRQGSWLLEAGRLLFKPLGFQLRGPHSAQARMPGRAPGALWGRKAGSSHPTRSRGSRARNCHRKWSAFGHLERPASHGVDTALCQTPAGTA